MLVGEGIPQIPTHRQQNHFPWILTTFERIPGGDRHALRYQIRSRRKFATKPNKLDIELSEQIALYYADPLGFINFAFEWGKPGTFLEHFTGVDKWHEELLTKLGEQVKANAFDGRHAVDPIRWAVSSGHGAAKSTLMAWLACWIMSTRPHSQGTITANTYTQIQTKTWAAIQKWMKACITSH